MKKFKTILFDLDGTLIDTTPLILESFRHTFKYHFNEVKSDSELTEYLGIPLRGSFERLYPDMVEILLKTYREFNESRHDRYVGVFIGVPGVLQSLRDRNITVGLVTSKRKELALRGLGLFDLAGYMQVIVGPEDTRRHKPDGDPVLKALEIIGCESREEVLYVGDSAYDICCAKNAGVVSGAVGWSYIGTYELAKACPDIFLESPSDLLAYI